MPGINTHSRGRLDSMLLRRPEAHLAKRASRITAPITVAWSLQSTQSLWILRIPHLRSEPGFSGVFATARAACRARDAGARDADRPARSRGRPLISPPECPRDGSERRCGTEGPFQTLAPAWNRRGDGACRGWQAVPADQSRDARPNFRRSFGLDRVSRPREWRRTRKAQSRSCEWRHFRPTSAGRKCAESTRHGRDRSG